MNRNYKHGQGLVEFALVLPILLLLVVGVLDLSRLFHAKVVINNAAREGAYFLSYTPRDKTNCIGSVCYQGTLAASIQEANNSGIQLTPADIYVNNSLCCTHGQPIEVQVNYAINLAIIDFFTGPIDLSSSVRMLVQ